jgi:uncharacterized membrane protein
VLNVLEFPLVVGRLHPLVLHAPIVLVPAALVLEFLATRGRIPRRALFVVLALGAASAVATAATGWVLGQEDGYGGDRLERHEQLGIALAVLTTLALLLHGRDPRGPRLLLARLLVLAACGVLVPGAHLGATLTHGVDWLSPGPRRERPGVEPVEPTPPGDGTGTSGEVPADDGAPTDVYAQVVAPILASRCASCHGTAKKKGGLRLHEPAAILRGGYDGPALVAGDPAASLMLQRARLPLEDEDHMPPDGKPQPTEEELAAIESWIAAGADFGAALEATPDDPGDPGEPETE